MRQILRAVRVAAHSNGHAKECLASLADHLHVKHVFGVSSGRAALWLILKSMRHLRPERDVVAVPAYTCFSVAAAVVRAGLKIHPVEIDPHTLDFDFCELDRVPVENLLCVVPSNLFGFLSDLARVREAAQAKGAFVLDDAAQALGAKRHGQFAGTGADVGLYSLARGKTVTAMEGGLIVTNSDEIARVVKQEASNLNAPSLTHGARLLLEMLVYSVLLRPNLYWIPNSIPALKLGVTEFDPGFRAEELHSLCLALLPEVLNELPDMNIARQTNAAAVTEALAGNESFEVPQPAADTRPTFVRLPVIARDSATRDTAMRELHRAGIGASASYPTALCDIPEIAPHMAVADFHRRKAELLSERLLTLPVHPFVSKQDVNRMVGILNTL